MTSKSSGSSVNYTLSYGSTIDDPNGTSTGINFTSPPGAMSGGGSTTGSDSGSAVFTIAGHTVTATWASGSSASGIGSSLASQLTTALSGTGITVSSSGSGGVAVVALSGGVANSSLAAGTLSYDTAHFASPSFTFAIAGMSGGTSGGSGRPVVYRYAMQDSAGGSGYAANGNVRNVTDSVTGSWTYGYDALNRLTSAAAPAGFYQGLAMAWSYDNWGNPLAQSVPALVTGVQSKADHWATYDVNNRVTSSNASGAVVSPTYDSSGNVTADGDNTVKYDAEGRVCADYNGSVYTAYIYNSAGQRVQKGTITSWSCDRSSNGYSATTRYVLDMGGSMVTEETWTGSAWVRAHTDIPVAAGVTATFVHSGSSDTLHYNFSDWLGSKRVQADASGSVESTWGNLPFGDQQYRISGTADATQRHFTGKERDAESGLDYFGARYYASSAGRFISPDPLMASAKSSNPQTWNRYAYVLDNPLAFVDPDGMDVSAKCAKDKNCPIYVNINVIYDSKAKDGWGRPLGLTKKQKDDFEAGQLAKAKKDFKASNIILSITYAKTGTWDENAKGEIAITGLKADAINLVVGTTTPQLYSASSGLRPDGTAVIFMAVQRVTDWNHVIDLNDTELELAHYFAGDIARGDRGSSLRDYADDFSEAVRNSGQNMSKSQGLYRNNLQHARYSMETEPSANIPQK